MQSSSDLFHSTQTDRHFAYPEGVALLCKHVLRLHFLFSSFSHPLLFLSPSMQLPFLSIPPLSLSLICAVGLQQAMLFECVWGGVTGFSGLPGLLKDVSVPLKRGCRCQSNFPVFVIFAPFYLSGSSVSPCVKTKRPCLSDASESMSKAARGGIFDLRKWRGCFSKNKL